MAMHMWVKVILLLCCNFKVLPIFGYAESLSLHGGLLSCGEQGRYSVCSSWASHCSGFYVEALGLSGMWASVVVARGLHSCGSRALEYRLSSCSAGAQLVSTACGIFPDLGSIPCPMHWQADSLPLNHQGIPGLLIYHILYNERIWKATKKLLGFLKSERQKKMIQK